MSSCSKAVSKSSKRKKVESNSSQPNDGITGSDCARSSIGSRVTLKKQLGLISGVGLIFGNVIGSGIFITTRSIFGYTQSFGLTLVVWIVGGIIAFVGSLCYCELGTMIQKSGSEYAYILEAYSFPQKKNKYLKVLGEMLAFTNVWYDFLVGNPSSLAIPLLTFGKYVCRAFFIGCNELPILPVKLIALAALSKFLSRPLE